MAVFQVIAGQFEPAAQGRGEHLLLHELLIRLSGHFFNNERQQQETHVGVLLRGAGFIGQPPAQLLLQQRIQGRVRREHRIPAPGREPRLVPQQVFHRNQVIVIVLDIAVIAL